MKIYLEFPGTEIKGEANNVNYKDQIEIETVVSGFQNSFDIGSKISGGGAGKSQSQGFEIVKNFDSSSNELLSCLNLGKPLDSAVLHFTRMSGKPETNKRQDFLTIKLKMVFIESIHVNYSEGSFIQEEIVLNYGAMQQTYFIQDLKGNLREHNMTEFSYVLNKDVFKV